MASTALAPTSPSNSRTPVVYQIDFTAVASGKRIASSKRRVRWRFGFANPEALANGQTGTDCRGEEHDITLVWSVTSGKRLILADGQEVHYSNNRGNIFDFSWTMKGNHVLKVVAHASPPMSATPGFRQYDFFVDGQSFFTFPKVYKVGLSANDPRGSQRGGPPPAAMGTRSAYNNYTVPPAAAAASSPNGRKSSAGIASIEAPHTVDEEEMYLREAIKNSMIEQGPPPGSDSVAGGSMVSAPPPAPGGNDLLNFAAPAPPTAPQSSFPALPAPAPVAAAATDPWASSTAPAPVAPAAPVAADPWGAPAPAATANGYGYGYTAGPPAGQPLPALPASVPEPAAPPQPTSDFPTAPAPAAPYGASPAQPPAAPYGAPAPVAPSYDAPAQPPALYGAPTGTQPPAQPLPPAPYGAPPAQQPTQQYAPSAVPPAAGFASPPTQQQPLPYASPPAPVPFTSPEPAPDAGAPPQSEAAPTAETDAPAATSVDPALLTMNKLSGEETVFDSNNKTDGSLADQAYAKFATMDNFSLVSKKEEKRANPFEASMSQPIGSGASLSEMKSQSKVSPSKEIMKSPVPAPGAMVVSQQQQGNFGGYAQQQYGAPPMNQPPMQQPAYGQQPPMQQPAMNHPPMQQQQYGAAPMSQPPMQQPQYGMQQPAYGQPPPMQQPAYGQPPPVTQSSYGQPPFQQ